MRLTEFQDCYNVSQNFKKKEQSLQKKKKKDSIVMKKKNLEMGMGCNDQVQIRSTHTLQGKSSSSRSNFLFDWDDFSATLAAAVAVVAA